MEDTSEGTTAERKLSHLKVTTADDAEGEDVQDDAAEAGHLAREVSNSSFPAAPLRSTPSRGSVPTRFCIHALSSGQCISINSERQQCLRSTPPP